jgi:hypothetical protein
MPTGRVDRTKRGRFSLTFEYVAQLTSTHAVIRATANREKFGLGYEFISMLRLGKNRRAKGSGR